MSNGERHSLNWSDKVYLLSDIADKMKVDNCIVKSDEPICSELDCFEVMCFKHIYCVRAFKVSTSADKNTTEDSKNNNSGNQTLTSGDEVFIPLHYIGRGSIVPLYGESHVCKTVEELIMTFPRYVLIEEDLKIYSESKVIQLKAGSELELLRNSRDKHNQDKLICRYGAETLQLNASDIGRFRVRPDPNLYTVKDILQRLKLPQIIDFKEVLQDQWEKEINFFEGLAPEQNYMGKFLLTGLFKDKVAVAVSLTKNYQPKSEPFLLPLSADLLQHLMFKFAFRGDFSEFTFKTEQKRPEGPDNDTNQKKSPKKKPAKLKRGKSEADLSQNQQIPFELTYTQYRFPQTQNKSANQGDKIFKKVQSALKSVKGKFKKASPKDVAAIRDNVIKAVTPEPIRKASNKLYPILADLMNEDSTIYEYITSGSLGRKSGQRQSQFYYEIEAPKIASAPTEEILMSETPVTEKLYRNPDGDMSKTTENEENNIYENLPPIRKEIRAETETIAEPEVDYATIENKEVKCGDEVEIETGNHETVDTKDCIYMNYNEMATLKIRRRSSPQRTISDFTEYIPTEEVSQETDWNEAATTQCSQTTEERSDISTEEESSSLIYTDLDDYESELKNAVADKPFPVPAKRNLSSLSKTTSAAEASAIDGDCGNVCTNDAGSDIASSVSNDSIKEEAAVTASLESMSVAELCEILQQCGLDRISKLCKEHSLDGAFICALPADSLQEQPFSLSPIEVMKLSMMKKGWKPKII